jgi:hypothetical protein
VATSPYRWNARARRYVDEQGRFISRAEVRDALAVALDRAKAQGARMGKLLVENEITLTAWYSAMRTLVKDVQLYSAALAKGGWAQMSAADFGRVGGLTARQYKYLDRFVRQIANGLILDGRFTVRVNMYMEAGRTTFMLTEREEARQAGMTEERNRTRPAEHCQQCIAETDKGWVPIGALTPIGQRTCLSHCKCYMEYR